MALARVLTSIENLAILEEKEKKKKELAGTAQERARGEEKKEGREKQEKGRRESPQNW